MGLKGGIIQICIQTIIIAVVLEMILSGFFEEYVQTFWGKVMFALVITITSKVLSWIVGGK